MPRVVIQTPESEVRSLLRAGRAKGVIAKVLFRPVGSNQAVVEIVGQKFTIDASRRLIDAGLLLDSSRRKTILRGKTSKDVTRYFARFPKLNAEDFSLRSPRENSTGSELTPCSD